MSEHVKECNYGTVYVKAQEVAERDTDVDFNEVAPRLLKSRLAVFSYDKSFCNA